MKSSGKSKNSDIKEGILNGEGLKFTLIVSRFNSLITAQLEEGAQDCLIRHGVLASEISVVRVPGAFEIPLAASWTAKAIDASPAGEKNHAIICLGAVIRGGTPHFDYVAAEVSKGISTVSLETGIPIGFGVLTCDTLEQALERAGSKAGNKGWEAAIATLEMAALRFLLQEK